MQNKYRPVFLNLIQIRLPAAGFMSILHRVAGVLLFLSIPFFIYLLQLVLLGEQGYANTKILLSSPIAWALISILFWALIHHLLAGMRYLLLDVHIGVKAPNFRYTAWAVMLLAPVLALLVSWRILP